MGDHPTTPADRDPTSRPTAPAPDRADRPLVAAHWSALEPRRTALAESTARAVALAAAYEPTAPDQPAAEATTRPTGRGRRSRPVGTEAAGRVLRLVPPVAALTTAAVMQVIAVTDTVGTAIATTARTSAVGVLADHPSVGYLAGLLLGIAVASCAEGGAAYLMDLYDKHLLARDSVWVLRLAMLVYVGGSAAAIHWWAAYRHLPTITSWLLAAMSASSLFLWSRGSRWRNREAMRAAGQLDPAMPRLAMAAKIMHPVRWVVTLWLVSWEPVETTAEARARYETWRRARADRHRTTARTADRTTGRTDAPTGEPTGVVADQPTGAPTRVRPTVEPTRPTTASIATPPTVPQPTTPEATAPAVDRRPARADRESTAPRPTASVRPAVPLAARPTGQPTVRLVHGPTAIADATMIRKLYKDEPPGRNELLRRHGGNAERWTKALKAHRDGADQADQPAPTTEADPGPLDRDPADLVEVGA